MLEPFHRRRFLGHLAVYGVAVPSMALALTGCASGPAAQASDEEALLLRANTFWKAIQENDGVASWNYEELSQKPGWTLQAYLKRGGGVVYDEIKVLGVASLNGDKATVNVQITYSLPQLRMNNQAALFGDEWVRLDGVWYHADRPSIL